MVLMLVALYEAAIVLANLLAAHFGPTASIADAFFLIGLDLVTRDRLADFWGPRRMPKMAALIFVGSALSWLVNHDAQKVAIASAIAFAAAELGETAVYIPLARRLRWPERAIPAAAVGAAIDSLIFPTLAFGGFMWATTSGQWLAKVAGAALWAIPLGLIRRRTAPEVA